MSQVGVLVTFGCLHTALTPLNYSLHTIEAAWFAGTGLMLISSGLLNVVALQANQPNVFGLRAAAVVDGLGLMLGVRYHSSVEPAFGLTYSHHVTFTALRIDGSYFGSTNHGIIHMIAATGKARKSCSPGQSKPCFVLQILIVPWKPRLAGTVLRRGSQVGAAIDRSGPGTAARSTSHVCFYSWVLRSRSASSCAW